MKSSSVIFRGLVKALDCSGGAWIPEQVAGPRLAELRAGALQRNEGRKLFLPFPRRWGPKRSQSGLMDPDSGPNAIPDTAGLPAFCGVCRPQGLTAEEVFQVRAAEEICT